MGCQDFQLLESSPSFPHHQLCHGFVRLSSTLLAFLFYFSLSVQLQVNYFLLPSLVGPPQSELACRPWTILLTSEILFYFYPVQDPTIKPPHIISERLVENGLNGYPAGEPSSHVHAYITGHALDSGNRVCFINEDGKTPYFPDSPPHTIYPVPEKVAIKMGSPGSITTINIPHLAGGRIWFSMGKKLEFFLNPGPAIVEPSVTNNSDANINTTWDFCEFTFSNGAIYANISYVDFVSLPIAIKLRTPDGGVQEVLGLEPDGLARICNGLHAQSKKDCGDWDKLVISSSGQNPRALSPNNAAVASGGNLFKGYYDAYVDKVWSHYSKHPLTVDTHAQWGKLTGQVSKGELQFPDGLSFSKPSTGDIFSCSTGPFANNSGALGPLTARISAGLNRSTLLLPGTHPNDEEVFQFYKEHITNHYARLVHEANIDGRGYAFPYDDVPCKGLDQSGFVNGPPKKFVVTIG